MENKQNGNGRYKLYGGLLALSLLVGGASYFLNNESKDLQAAILHTGNTDPNLTTTDPAIANINTGGGYGTNSNTYFYFEGFNDATKVANGGAFENVAIYNSTQIGALSANVSEILGPITIDSTYQRFVSFSYANAAGGGSYYDQNATADILDASQNPIPWLKGLDDIVSSTQYIEHDLSAYTGSVVYVRFNFPTAYDPLNGNTTSVGNYGFKYKDIDTDQDGLTDAQEDCQSYATVAPCTSSNKNDSDSDDDGLTDYEELNAVECTVSVPLDATTCTATGFSATDPTNPDSDGGGTNDGDEATNNTDPNDASVGDTPPACGTVGITACSSETVCNTINPGQCTNIGTACTKSSKGATYPIKSDTTVGPITLTGTSWGEIGVALPNTNTFPLNLGGNTITMNVMDASTNNIIYTTPLSTAAQQIFYTPNILPFVTSIKIQFIFNISNQLLANKTAVAGFRIIQYNCDDGCVDGTLIDGNNICVDNDTDNDGIPDGDEPDPLCVNDSDCDDDGLTDYEEVNAVECTVSLPLDVKTCTATGFSATDPMDADSDDGGVNDGVEATNNTNPNDLSVGDDTDNDGVIDILEPDPSCVNDSDCDDDGIEDGDELCLPAGNTYAVCPSVSDPQNDDDDNDGVPTADEIGADPANPQDTDNDGTPDYLDTDDDNDTVPTSTENAVPGVDTDNDGTPNYLDTDDDNDGILTATELVGTGNGYPLPATDPLDSDSDNDGLLDGEEVNGCVYTVGTFVCSSTTFTATNPNDADTDDGTVDDGDEVNAGTDPAVNAVDDKELLDSDNDGLSDAEEECVSLVLPSFCPESPSDPLDPDSDDDGLTDEEEAQNDTDPANPDSDNDGLMDGEEVDGCVYSSFDAATNTPMCSTDVFTSTDPMDSDSDNDGLLDGPEVNTYGTDPLDPDTDDGGANDGQEILDGTNPVDEPLDDMVDSDNDGLSDYYETTVSLTNPNDNDTDNDGLLDGREVNTYNTDPLDADTDNGGVNDGTEVLNGTNPLNPNNEVPVVNPVGGAIQNTQQMGINVKSVAESNSNIGCSWVELEGYTEGMTPEEYLATGKKIPSRVMKVDAGGIGYYQYCPGRIAIDAKIRDKGSFRGFVSERTGGHNRKTMTRDNDFFKSENTVSDVLKKRLDNVDNIKEGYMEGRVHYTK